MIILSGKLLQVYSTPTGTNKEGENYGGEKKIQVMNEVKLRNGEMKIEVVEINAPVDQNYSDLIGQNIELQVNIRPYKNKLYFEAI